MFLRCITYITIIILRYILYSVYLCPCLVLGLFMSYICDVFFFFILVFIAINYVTPLKQMYFFFLHFLEYLLLFLNDNMDQTSKQCLNSECSASGCCLAIAYFFTNFSVTLIMKMLLIRERVYQLTMLIYA